MEDLTLIADTFECEESYRKPSCRKIDDLGALLIEYTKLKSVLSEIPSLCHGMVSTLITLKQNLNRRYP